MPSAAVPVARRPPERRGVASKGDRREQAILDALESLLTEVPLAKVSIGQIASRAGVGRTAFYFYFASREAALTALAERSLAPVYDAASEWFYEDGDPGAALRRGLEGVVEVWEHQSHLFIALIDSAAHELAMLELWREQIEAIVAVAGARIERDSDRGLTWDGMDAAQTARALAWMTERYCYMYVPDRPWRRSRGDIVSVLWHLWWHAIYRSG